ncbi:hypothetical protein MPLB_1810038 [Mesorhizobium sp. ORS 3324]|nr:hypothetical protein MPLB_1810038 [Mesorhizobium sp. ORS 3324]
MLRERIELSTSPLPRECSTTELPQPAMAALLPYRTGKRKAKKTLKTTHAVVPKPLRILGDMYRLPQP